MDGYTVAIPEKELGKGMMKTIHIGTKAIALANVDGEFFAVDDACSHKQCSLGTEGALDGTVVICGCHGAQFDVTNGHVKALPAVINVGSYSTKVENGQVWIKV